MPLTGLLAAQPVRAQDLVGCQLVEGSLQCVPGLTADPQTQIRILEGKIARDQQLEGVVEQRIEGLQNLVLQGETRVGGLLQAGLAADVLSGLPDSSFHWYRRAPGRNHWELVRGASGPRYPLTSNDIAYEILLVVAVPKEGGSQRVASAPVGPIRAVPPSP